MPPRVARIFALDSSSRSASALRSATLSPLNEGSASHSMAMSFVCPNERVSAPNPALVVSSGARDGFDSSRCRAYTRGSLPRADQ